MTTATPAEIKGKKGLIPSGLVLPPSQGTPWSAANGSTITPGGSEVFDLADPEMDPDKKRKIPDPFDINVDAAGLKAAQKSLITEAQRILGKVSEGKPAYVFGGEGAQHGGTALPQLLINAGDAGFDVMQPSGNHIDLARCARDAAYAAWVLAVHKAANIPLLSVSVHMDAYFDLSALHSKRARAIQQGEGEFVDDEQLQQLLHHRMAEIIVGAARLGIQVLHLFWGQPGEVPAYGWPFHEPGGANVQRMRELFVQLVKPLVELAAKVGIYLCHEIHYGTIAMNAGDLIKVWEMMGKPANFCVGFDPSHFWHGEQWWNALDKLVDAGMKVYVCHFKQAVLLDGRAKLGYEADDRFRGMMFSVLDASQGIVDMNLYAGQLTLKGVGLAEFWHGQCDLPIPGYAEAEDPHWNTWDVLVRGVGYLQRILGGMHLPKAHFTAEMKKAS